MAPTRSASYWALTREHRYSLIFALPLFLLYEGLAALRSHDFVGGVRNGADVILKSLFVAAAGQYGPAAFGLLLVGITIFLIARDLKRNREPLRRNVFVGMTAESVLLALVFGFAVSAVTSQLLAYVPHLMVATAPQGRVAALSPMTEFTVSLGAGLYEELVFRVLLTSGLAMGIRLVLGAGGWVGGAIAAVISALVFSAFHYIGPYGDRLELGSFAFRAVAGLFFSALYLTRGFGVTAWTHALYDIFLLAARS